MYQTVYVLDEPVVTIKGNDNALCGDTVTFEAEVTNADPSCWSLTWEKTREHVTESIDINKENYKGSTARKLIITSVSKEDEWIYQAVLSRKEITKRYSAIKFYYLLSEVFPTLELNYYYNITTEIIF